MRLKDDQLARLADTVFSHLEREGALRLKGERAKALQVIREAVAAEMRKEQDLEREAERLLEDTLRGMGSAAAGIDRHRMLKMIKDRLAKEKKIVL